MTAFGSHEWFSSAMMGEIHTPIGDKDGDVNVKVFVVNYKIGVYYSCTCHSDESTYS